MSFSNLLLGLFFGVFMALITPWVFVDAELSPYHETQVIFKQQGLLYAPTDILHVAIRLNISELYTACDLYTEYARNLSLAMQFSYPGFLQDSKLNQAYIQTRTRLLRACETPILFYTLSQKPDHPNVEVFSKKRPSADPVSPNASSTPPSRPPRSAAALAGGAILASAGLGIYNTYQLSQLSQNLDVLASQVKSLNNNILLIEKTNARISDLTTDVSKSYSTLTELVEFVHSSALSQIQALAAMQEFSSFVLNLANLIGTFERGFAQLDNHKLSLDLITPTRLIDIWQSIHERASDSAKALFQHPFDLLHLPASYTIYADMSLTVFLHVPLAATQFNLFKYVPFPIIPDDTELPLIVKPKHDRYFLAITTSQQAHLEFSTDELSQNCYNFYNNYICDDISFFHTRPDSTCLSSLYTGQQHALDRLCHISEFQHDFVSHCLERNKILVFSRIATSYKIVCPQNSSDVRGKTLYGHSIIDLDPQCRIDAPDFHIQSTAMSYLKTTVSFPILYNFTHLTGGTSLAEVKLIRQKLINMDIKPEAEIRDMIQQAKNSFKTVQHFPHMGSNLVMGGLACAFVIVLLMTCCCSQILRKEIRVRVKTLMQSLYAISNAQQTNHFQQQCAQQQRFEQFLTSNQQHTQYQPVPNDMPPPPLEDTNVKQVTVKQVTFKS